MIETHTAGRARTNVAGTPLAIVALAALGMPAATAAQGMVYTLVPDDASSGSAFGHVMDFEDPYLVVGDPYESAAYVFDYPGLDQRHRLAGSDTTESDNFGDSVSIDGGRILVGASGSNFPFGGAYVFDAATGAEIVQLLPNDPSALWAGENVALSGNFALVACEFHKQLGVGTGAVYVFDATTGQLLHFLTASDAASGTWFGRSVAADGNLALVGSPYAGINFAGAAYLFDLTTGQEIRQWTGIQQDLLGEGMLLEGNVGALGGAQIGGSGGFRIVDVTTGEEKFDITASLVTSGDEGFPDGLDIENGLILAGGSHADLQTPMFFTGGAWLFDASTGQELASFTSPTPSDAERFGSGAALANGQILIGARLADVGGNVDGGAVYQFGPDASIYCTAKTNSLGCVPSVGFSGVPSASLGSFDVVVTNVLNNKNGVVFYGLNGPAAAPFLGGTLCVTPPLRRTTITSSAGNPPPNDCSGSYGFDFNAWILAGSDANLQPGASVWTQVWSRDPGQADGTGSGLSDGLEFFLGP